MSREYCSYSVRTGRQLLETEVEKTLMKILMDFGYTVDPHGYDDGDYDGAMFKLLEMFDSHKGLG